MATCQHSGCRMKPGSHDLCIHHRPDNEFPECSICLKAIRRTKDTLDCHHSFHRRCIDNWAERSHTCPMCRAPFMDPPVEEPWINVLGETLHEQINRAIHDLNSGAGSVDIHIQFNIPQGAPGS